MPDISGMSISRNSTSKGDRSCAVRHEAALENAVNVTSKLCRANRSVSNFVMCVMKDGASSTMAIFSTGVTSYRLF